MNKLQHKLREVFGDKSTYPEEERQMIKFACHSPAELDEQLKKWKEEAWRVVWRQKSGSGYCVLLARMVHPVACQCGECPAGAGTHRRQAKSKKQNTQSPKFNLSELTNGPLDDDGSWRGRFKGNPAP